MRKENCKTTANLVFLIQQEENIHKVSVNNFATITNGVKL